MPILMRNIAIVNNPQQSTEYIIPTILSLLNHPAEHWISSSNDAIQPVVTVHQKEGGQPLTGFTGRGAG